VFSIDLGIYFKKLGIADSEE